MAADDTFSSPGIRHESGGHEVPRDLFGPPASEQEFSHNLLAERNHILDDAVKAAVADKILAVGAERLPATSDYFLARLDQSILDSIGAIGYDTELAVIAPPTQNSDITKNVDLALNAVKIAKQAQQNPLEVASRIATNLTKQTGIEQAVSAGPFVNASIDYSVAGPEILAEVAKFKHRYGYFRDGEPQLVIVDYSSPNVAKNMTLAHLRSTIIGHTLTKIQQAVGNVPFGVNHIGDWGTQFGSIIYQYKKELAERGEEFLTELVADPTATLMHAYRKFNELQKDNPESADAAREIFLKLEQGDPELVELWDQFRTWSLSAFGPSYEQLRVSFDAIQGESFYEDRMTPVVEDALAKHVLKTNEDGAIVFPSQPLTNPSTGSINDRVMLDQGGKPRDEIIIKPSGGTVYLTRDLAAIRYRAEELGADKILYVIGKEQQTHCMELFAMAHQLGYVALGGAEHISFGHLNVDGRKMKSREGKVALLSEIVDEAVAAASGMLSERKILRGEAYELDDEELEIARKIGTSALIFNDLRQDRQKDIEFSPNMAKTLEAGGASYIQYTDSRLGSILKKLGEPSVLTPLPSLSTAEREVLMKIALLPVVIKQAAEFNAPHRVATYLTAFCRTVNVFYHDHSIANADTEQERNFRLHLVKAAKQVIENASNLLHIELPGRM